MAKLKHECWLLDLSLSPPYYIIQDIGIHFKTSFGEDKKKKINYQTQG